MEEERTIKIDKLIEDLKYDIDKGYKSLQSGEVDDFNKPMVQFDVDCKANFVWWLEEEYERQHNGNKVCSV